MIDLKYHSCDNGNCRVYYTANKRRYCMQLCNKTDFELLTCSKDWEPECLVTPGFVKSIEFPNSDERIAIELRAFLLMEGVGAINRKFR